MRIMNPHLAFAVLGALAAAFISDKMEVIGMVNANIMSASINISAAVVCVGARGSLP